MGMGEGKGNFGGTGGYSSGSTVAGNAGGYGNPSSPTGGTGGQTQNSYNSGNWGGGFSGMGYANDAANKAALQQRLADVMGSKGANNMGNLIASLQAQLKKKPVPVPVPKPKPAVKIVSDPLTGNLIAIDDVTGQPIPDYDFNIPYSPSPWDNYPLGGKPIASPGPKIQDRVGVGSSGFMGAPPSLGPGSTHQGQSGAYGGFGNVNNQQGPSADIGTGGDVSGGGLLGGSPSGMGDVGAMRMMMAAPEAPLVSPGPIGPGGQPMGNRPPMGAPLMLRHAYNRPMQRQRPAFEGPTGRPGGGRRDQRAVRLLRTALSRGRAT